MQGSNRRNSVFSPSDHLLSDTSLLDLLFDHLSLRLVKVDYVLNVHFMFSRVSRSQVDQLLDILSRRDRFVSIFLVKLDEVRFYICSG